MKILPLFTPFDIYIFVLLAIVVGITGVVLLVVGISRKKLRLWVSAIFILLIALILGSTGIFLGVRKIMRQADKNSDKDYNYRWFNDRDAEEVDESFMDILPEESYVLETEAVVIDEDGNSEFIPVIATEKLRKRGLAFEPSDSLPESDDLDENNIYLNIKFNKRYRGYLQLKIFDEEKNGLAKSEVEIDIDDTISLQLTFHFEDDIPFSELEYCTLSTQKD